MLEILPLLGILYIAAEVSLKDILAGLGILIFAPEGGVLAIFVCARNPILRSGGERKKFCLF